ncbi:hypothetical protein [Stenoxybacter acetivorans]|nr:hypothetical protein [Stenoxybacter acetivorans]
MMFHDVALILRVETGKAHGNRSGCLKKPRETRSNTLHWRCKE